MHTLSALLFLAAAAACTIARPPAPDDEPDPVIHYAKGTFPMEETAQRFMLHRVVIPRYKDDFKKNDHLYDGHEIDHLFDESGEDPLNAFVLEWIGPGPAPDTPASLHDFLQDYNNYGQFIQNHEIHDNDMPLNYRDSRYFAQSDSEPDFLESEITTLQHTLKESKTHSRKDVIDNTTIVNDKDWKMFALTPKDKEFFESAEEETDHESKPTGTSVIQVMHHEGTAPKAPALVLEPPRQIRQNPTLSKQKHLVEPDLGKLKVGLVNKDYRMPVSLLPTNLRWLKINQPKDDEESSHEDGDVTNKPQHIHVMESASDPADSVYGVALIAAVAAASMMAILGFAFGWYTLSKKAKAAADVDYPAYGVTGPNIDTSGDRKLAHSAHMYHYQHQKQQIIAMERNGLEQRAGSISDPESEEENEEGDYTVYECPGFATTGDMEVKNPLFSEDPTPATPGKCEVVKPQPKN